MFVLDADILSLASQNHDRLTSRITEAESVGNIVAISIVTWAEVLKGRIEYLLKAADQAHWLRALDRLAMTIERLSKVEVLPISVAAADIFERLQADRQRKKSGHADLLIACIALATTIR